MRSRRVCDRLEALFVCQCVGACDVVACSVCYSGGPSCACVVVVFGAGRLLVLVLYLEVNFSHPIRALLLLLLFC